MRLKKYRRAIIVLGICFLLIIIGFGVVYGLWWKDTRRSFTVTFHKGEITENASVDAAVIVSKKWPDNDEQGRACVGAQYDIKLQNNMDVACKNWQVKITLPKELTIDSSWSGEYRIEDDKLIVLPDEEHNMIYPGETMTVGFVGYSFWILQMSEIEFTGYRDIAIQDYPGYIEVLALLVIWSVIAMVYVVIQFRIRKLDMQREKDEQIINQMMDIFAGFIDAKDPYTKGHSTRVSFYAKEIARRMQLKEDEIKKIGYIAMLHDCGKIGIPDEVLKKPESLTGEERSIIKAHTITGGKVLENFTEIEGLKDGALYHHERYDGTGYPFGLKGDEIPFYARIIGVADSFDTMNSDRCYRKRLPKDVILEELKKNAGTQFDPTIVKYMIDMIEDGFITFE